MYNIPSLQHRKNRQKSPSCMFSNTVKTDELVVINAYNPTLPRFCQIAQAASTWLHGHPADMPSRRHKKSTHRLVKSLTVKSTREQRWSTFRIWMTQTFIVKNLTIWPSSSARRLHYQRLGQLVSWLVVSTTWHVGNLTCYHLVRGAAAPADTQSSVQLACTMAATFFSYSRRFSRYNWAAVLFAGLFGFGSCNSDWTIK